MKQVQTDQEIEKRIKDCMRNQIQKSEQVDRKMEEAYEKIRKTKAAKNRKLPIAVKCTTAAAMLILAMVYFVKNPAVAAQLPFIGHIFSGLEDQVSYPGDYSKNAIKLPVKTDPQKETQADAVTDIRKETQADAGTNTRKETQADAVTDTRKETQADAEKIPQSDGQADINDTDEAIYQVTSNGITVTLSEVSYDQDAIYLAMLVESEKRFPKNLLQNNQLGFVSWVTAYKANGGKKEFNGPDGTFLAYEAEGEYIDSHTFQGIAQFQASKSDFNLSKYKACEITFTDFWQRLDTGEIKTANLPDTGEEVSWTEHEIVHQEGKWKFKLDVDVSADQRQEIAVNGANEEGYGIEKVIKTSYQMYAVPILPEGEKEYDYMITYWDADGKPLDSHGSDFTRASIYKRDISEVTIYLLRWDDFCESKGSNTHLQPEKAIYQTTVRFEE